MGGTQLNGSKAAMVQHGDTLHPGRNGLWKNDGEPTETGRAAGPATLSNLFAESLRTRVRHVFETAADELLGKAARIKEENAEDYQSAIQAAEHLQSYGTGLTEAYGRRVTERIETELAPPASDTRGRAGKPKLGPGRLSEAGITLLDDRDLEFSVTVSSMGAKFERRYQSVLQRIAEELSRLTDLGSISTVQHPLGVYPILNEFVDLVSQQGFDLELRMQLLDAFQFHVLEELDEIYQSILGLLKDSGPQRPGPTPQRPEQGAADPSDPQGAGAAAAASPGTAAPRSFTDWQRLLAARFGASSAPTAPASGTASVAGDGGAATGGLESAAGDSEWVAGGGMPGAGASHAATGPSEARGGSLTRFIGQQLARFLPRLARGADVAADAPAEARRLQFEPLYERVISELEASGQGGATGLSRSELDTLRLVSMLFEQILDDDRLSDPVRYLLVTLQLPVLRVALQDESLFEDDRHPVRTFLDVLAEFGIGWSSDIERVLENRTFRELEALVADVIEQIHDHPDYFEHALARLLELRKGESLRVQRAESRLIERESGRAKVKAAKLAVQQALNQLLRNVQAPAIVRHFAAESWSKVLVYLCIKFGAEQPEWTDAMELLKEVVRYAQPSSSDQELQRRELNMPHLLERLEQRMAFAGIGDAEIQRQSFALCELFRSLIEQDRQWFGGDGHYAVDGTAFEEIILLSQPCEGAMEALDPQVSEMLGRVQPGAWLQVSESGGELRYKVSAVFEQTDDVILVDDRGVKAAQWSREELAQRLGNGTVRLLDNHSLVEKAIDALMADLRAWQLEG